MIEIDELEKMILKESIKNNNQIFNNLAKVEKCPVCGEWDDVWGTVMCLNDEHGWSFLKIADWLDN